MFAAFDRTLSFSEEIANAIKLRIQQISSLANGASEIQKAHNVAINYLRLLCNEFASQSIRIQHYTEFLKAIIQGIKQEELQKKLTHEFLKLEDPLINSVDLTLYLMKHQLISVNEWDVQMAIFLKDNHAQINDQTLNFIAQFLQQLEILVAELLDLDRLFDLLFGGVRIDVAIRLEKECLGADPPDALQAAISQQYAIIRFDR